MAVTGSKIDSTVNQILSKYENLSLPIKIEEIARKEGLKIAPLELDDEVSGILAIENGQAVIGYNQTESRVRRRFTIAHELGHYFLHRDQSHLFVDKQFRAYRTANTAYNAKTQHFEQEANAFAAAILMPTEMVKKEVENTAIDLGSEDEIRDLAKLFDVSTTAMHFRLVNLNLSWKQL